MTESEVTEVRISQPRIAARKDCGGQRDAAKIILGESRRSVPRE